MHSPVHRLDKWIGKTLFIPLIIRICQWRKITQWAFSRYCWILALFSLLVRHPTPAVGDWAMYIIIVLVTIASIVMLAWWPDERLRPMGAYCRMIVLWALFVPFDVVGSILIREFHWAVFYWPLILFGDYAREIDQVPPLEQKERKEALVPARARGK